MATSDAGGGPSNSGHFVIPPEVGEMVPITPGGGHGGVVPGTPTGPPPGGWTGIVWRPSRAPFTPVSPEQSPHTPSELREARVSEPEREPAPSLVLEQHMEAAWPHVDLQVGSWPHGLPASEGRSLAQLRVFLADWLRRPYAFGEPSGPQGRMERLLAAVSRCTSFQDIEVVVYGFTEDPRVWPPDRAHRLGVRFRPAAAPTAPQSSGPGGTSA